MKTGHLGAILLLANVVACQDRDGDIPEDPFCGVWRDRATMPTVEQPTAPPLAEPAAGGCHECGLNGMSMQGISMQAMTMNGVTLAGIDLQDHAIGARLAGATLNAVDTDGGVISLSVIHAEPVAHGWAYAVEHDGRNLCGAGEQAVIVPGVWDSHGAYHVHLKRGQRTVDATLSCPSGVVAKCVQWGYAAGTALHQTCTRMARADYCGDGHSFTADGTLIDIQDDHATSVFDGEAGFEFEAGWGPDGAVCAARPRFQHIVNGTPVEPRCWSSLPRCATWANALDHEAMMGNASQPAALEHTCQPASE